MPLIPSLLDTTGKELYPNTDVGRGNIPQILGWFFRFSETITLEEAELIQSTRDVVIEDLRTLSEVILHGVDEDSPLWVAPQLIEKFAKVRSSPEVARRKLRYLANLHRDLALYVSDLFLAKIRLDGREFFDDEQRELYLSEYGTGRWKPNTALMKSSREYELLLDPALDFDDACVQLDDEWRSSSFAGIQGLLSDPG